MALIIGDLFGDVIWYCIGRFFAEPVIKKYGRFLRVTPEIFEKAKKLFNIYHKKILFFSKITLGLGMAVAVLMVAGATKTSFRTYMLINMLGEFVLVTVLLLVGYFFGQLYNSIPKDFKVLFLIIGGALLISIITFIIKYLKRKINVS